MKKVVRWYDELLALFKVAVQFEDIIGRVDKAVDLGESMPPEVVREKAGADDASMTSDSGRTLCGEQDEELDKLTVVEIEDADKPVREGLDSQQPHKRNWWRTVLNSIGISVRCPQLAAQVDQLRVLARGFILLTKMQIKWAQVQAMANRPGVDMIEVNKVTIVNIMELSSYTRRSKMLTNWANKIKVANKAMMQDADSIVQRSNQLEKDLDGFFKDHRRHQSRFVGRRACQMCFA
ncbi:uncharacterized protein ColSpa_11187 [Colletotrichum spaethianum]|uniref:Uncharacterized protein n=1 Tax=Colletotrichum spaethianum TaxID=700344 RepID=A0AA37PEV3_9PEZI|nr:uncharacterized protein ColSpa_11187 [Colletotrichum spaethianum]GKT51006.1 hypothetical protein ColSpa_11187 [Colletotrichum spaethianum]